MSAVRLAVFRTVVITLSGLGVLVAVIGDQAFFRVDASADGWTPEQAAWINGLFSSIWTTEALLAAAIVLALVWRAAERADARALACFFAFFTIFNFADSVQQNDWLPPSDAAQVAMGVLDSATWWLALAAFLRFSVLFPRPLTPADLETAGLPRWRAHLLSAGFVWGGAALLAPVAVGIGRFASGELGSGAPVALRLVGFVVFLGLIVGFLWGIVQGVRHLRIRYRTLDAAERRRILWVVQGFYLAMWAIFIGLAGLIPAALAAIGGAGGWVWPVLPLLAIATAPLVIMVFLAVGIFYDGAIDPALVIRRTTFYGAFWVVLTFLFAGVENLASSALAGRLGLPDGSAGWIAAGSVALVLGFARDGLARLLRRAVAPMTTPRETETGPSATTKQGSKATE